MNQNHELPQEVDAAIEAKAHSTFSNNPVTDSDYSHVAEAWMREGARIALSLTTQPGMTEDELGRVFFAEADVPGIGDLLMSRERFISTVLPLTAEALEREKAVGFAEWMLSHPVYPEGGGRRWVIQEGQTLTSYTTSELYDRYLGETGKG